MPRNSAEKGYQINFLGTPVKLPALNAAQQNDCVTLSTGSDPVINYVNYSVCLSASRRFPYFTASNIDGELFKKAPRKDNWRIDDRIEAAQQWGPKLYSAAKSDFDRGHMVKREDVQWGNSIAIASKAADSTFYYTNAVPQHAKLNQQIWRSLEDYILHTEAKDNGLKISVFTGPVLGKKDPIFVTKVEDEDVAIPTLFWKVVLFKKSDGHLYRAGFLMSQASLLKKNKIVQESLLESEDRLFMEFEEAETYQVNIATIEKLTGLTIPKAKETYEDDRKITLILKEIDVSESLLESASITAQLGFSIPGIQL